MFRFLCTETRTASFRIYDNRERDDATVKAVMHVGQVSYELPVTQLGNESYVYEFTYSSDTIGVGILEIYVDEVQIPESPFRVQVVERNCEIDFPGKGKIAVRVSSTPAGHTVALFTRCARRKHLQHIVEHTST